MRHSSLLRGSASLVALAVLTSAAYAQTPNPPAGGPGENPTSGPMPQSEDPAREQNTVDAIIVTAQRREQSLQDVPVVVTAISEETLDDAGIRDVKDLQVLVPGLVVTSTTSEVVTTARIRGVGTVGDNPGLESSVGVMIDGVYRPRNGVGFNDLGEISRIEVLKGRRAPCSAATPRRASSTSSPRPPASTSASKAKPPWATMASWAPPPPSPGRCSGRPSPDVCTPRAEFATATTMSARVKVREPKPKIRTRISTPFADSCCSTSATRRIFG
jgi:hypothetical protein